MYVRFPPQEHVSETYDVWIIHVTVYLKLSQTPNIGIYAPLTGTVAGPFGEIELSKSNVIILVYAIFIRF